MTRRNTIAAILLLGLLAPQLGMADCQIGCLSYLQISPGPDCIAEITPDMLLSGNNDCAGPYEVVVMTEDMIPIETSPHVTSAHAGMTLMASVIDTDSGNQCMSTLFIEDKFIPDLSCSDISIPCNVLPNITLPEQIIKDDGWLVNNGCTEVIINVNGIQSLADLNFAIDFTLDIPTGTTLSLRSPQGTSVDLFDGSLTAGCTNSEFNILFDDQATLDYQALVDACLPDSEIRGCYQPGDNLDVFLEDDQFNGNWIFTACAGVGENLMINLVDLQLSTGSILMPFPIPAGTQVLENGNNYLLEDFDACGPTILSFVDQSMDENCNSENEQTITRTWTATDYHGNSSSCSQKINITRPGLGDISLPPNFGPGGNPPLNCEDKMPDPGNQITPN
ncbi:MAG: hypothetical protein HKN16_02240, partial [Saprospiraceae bacterium]|nr:hypothetical protein [Saprospiraceae bacterium]